jgi:hypothetical protein
LRQIKQKRDLSNVGENQSFQGAANRRAAQGEIEFCQILKARWKPVREENASENI